MLYKEYCKSLKTPNYDKNFISEKIKICIDEMLEQNLSNKIIIESTNITEQQFKEYFNNEWCYKNPDRYFYVTWVEWVNLFIEDDEKLKQKSL